MCCPSAPLSPLVVRRLLFYSCKLARVRLESIDCASRCLITNAREILKLCATSVDEIETNGVSIQMRIETTNTNVLISGTNGQVYTLIQSNELVTITCGKTNCNDGFLAAFYNGARVAKQGPCANFADASSYTDYKCLYQTFQAILRVESSTHLIECRYDAANSTDSVKFTITKICMSRLIILVVFIKKNI